MDAGKARFPILLWGDLVKGGRPVLRRALAGFRAHECMYAWVYLTDYLAHKRLLDLVSAMNPQDCGELLKGLDGSLWTRFDRSLVDPHYQLSAAAYEPVAILTCLAADFDDRAPTFTELGSTFFASKTKFEIIDQLAAKCFSDWPQLKPKWIGIDNSRFMHDTTRTLHGQGAVELLDDYRALPRLDGLAIFLSRFVTSYVFSSASEFADFIAERFQIALIEDAYSTTEDDAAVFNHGQAEIFFSIPMAIGRLEQVDFDIYLLDTYPEFPAGSAPCHVIRYIAIKKGLLRARAKERLASLGIDSMNQPTAVKLLLQQLNSRIPRERWRAIKKAKRESPVWGRTPEESNAGTWNSYAQKVKEAIKRYWARSDWHDYRLEGPMAIREIDRAIRDEKP